MFAEAPSQLLMLLVPLAVTVLLFLRRNAPRKFVQTGVAAALLAAVIYIISLFFIEGGGPLFLIGYADTLLMYLPLCVAVSGLLSLGSVLRGNAKRTSE